MHGVAQATLYATFEETVLAINEVFADTISFPWGNIAELERMADDFAARNDSLLPGVVLAVDGIAIKIQRPTLSDTANPSHFFSRKGFYALNTQAGVDADLRFRFVSVATVGSTHDSLAFTQTTFYSRLEAGHLAEQFYFVADEAYQGSDQVVTPWPGRNLPSSRDAFNFHQSRCATMR